MGGVSALSVSDQCDHPCTAGKAKVLKRLNDELKDLQVFCISLLLYGFKKTGERGHLIMHIIWGYIQSLGFKLLDERLPWINVIFPLAYGHLLRAGEKSLYVLLLLIIFITAPSGSSSFWNPSKRLDKVPDFLKIIIIIICSDFIWIKLLWNKCKVMADFFRYIKVAVV